MLDTATSLTMVIAETTGTETIYYLHGLGLVAQSDGTTTEYFYQDGLGSVRQLTDATGGVLLVQTFDPYGNPYLSAAATGAQSAYGWAGEQRDGNGLVFLRARYYNPSHGRFLNIDPSRQEMNPYQFGGANPVMFTDPSGTRYRTYRSHDDRNRGQASRWVSKLLAKSGISLWDCYLGNRVSPVNTHLNSSYNEDPLDVTKDALWVEDFDYIYISGAWEQQGWLTLTVMIDRYDNKYVNFTVGLSVSITSITIQVGLGYVYPPYSGPYVFMPEEELEGTLIGGGWSLSLNAGMGPTIGWDSILKDWFMDGVKFWDAFVPSTITGGAGLPGLGFGYSHTFLAYDSHEANPWVNPLITGKNNPWWIELGRIVDENIRKTIQYDHPMPLDE